MFLDRTLMFLFHTLGFLFHTLVFKSHTVVLQFHTPMFLDRTLVLFVHNEVFQCHRIVAFSFLFLTLEYMTQTLMTLFQNIGLGLWRLLDFKGRYRGDIVFEYPLVNVEYSW